MNAPPDILIPEQEFTTLTLVRDDTRLQVVANDPEGEPVYFIWDAPADLGAPLTTTDGELTLSALSVPRDPRYDGEQIQVLITDGELPNGQFRTWYLEVE